MQRVLLKKIQIKGVYQIEINFCHDCIKHVDEEFNIFVKEIVSNLWDSTRDKNVK